MRSLRLGRDQRPLKFAPLLNGAQALQDVRQLIVLPCVVQIIEEAVGGLIEQELVEVAAGLDHMEREVLNEFGLKLSSLQHVQCDLPQVLKLGVLLLDFEVILQRIEPQIPDFVLDELEAICSCEPELSLQSFPEILNRRVQNVFLIELFNAFHHHSWSSQQLHQEIKLISIL